MPKRLSVQPYLSVAELEQQYRPAQDPIARGHRPMVWLLARGLAPEPVAAVTGYTANWVRTIAQRYNQHGPTRVGDRRHRDPGSAGLLPAAPRAALASALDRPPPDGALWTGPKVAAWMAATLGRPVHPQRGGAMLQRLGLRPEVPRPRHAKAAPAVQAAFKQSFPG